jgi:hypothetical protein
VSDEQFRLMAAILDALCCDLEAGLISHHVAFSGIGIGHCRLCGELGQLVGKGDKAVYAHKPSCLVSLNERLQQSLQEVPRD